MQDALAIVRRNGGVARTCDLVAAGLTGRQIAAACKSGRIERVRVGHFVDPQVPALAKQAHRVGGRPACVTAAMLYGLKPLKRHPLHVAVDRHDSKFRSPVDMTERLWPSDGGPVVLHWEHPDRARMPRLLVPLAEALRQVVACLDFEDAVCVLDSALHSMPDRVSVEALARIFSAAERAVLAHADGRSESVTETVFRVRGLEAGLRFQLQVPLPGDLRGDFLIGERLIVETDGAEYHSGPEAFASDRDRDAWLASLGYYVLRFSYDQVVNRWPEVLAAITLVMRHGDHLWPSNLRPV